MITPEQGLEAAFQTHLRSCRFWEAREGRPPVPEAELRRQFEEAGHHAYQRAEAIAAELPSTGADEPGPGIGEHLADLVARRLQQGVQVHHIHHHGPGVPIVRAKHAPHQEPGTVRLPE